MNTKWRVLLMALVLTAVFVPAASAQMECWQCDPWGSCDQSCWYCQVPHPDGYCNQYDVVYTTCGDATGACVEGNCSPNWVETGRVAVGTYGRENEPWACDFWNDCECDHHTVYRVTEEDTNQCNQSEYYWTRQFCDDVTDGWKYGNFYQDCCDGYPTSLFTCNGWHSCW